MKPYIWIFLDVDGVLNDHDYSEVSNAGTFKRENVQQFNNLLNMLRIYTLNVWVVLSSAWRYMIHNNAMTLEGFEYMMRTHGVSQKCKIYGVTQTDELFADSLEEIKKNGREIRVQQIKQYHVTLKSIARASLPERKDVFIVIDDLPLEFGSTELFFEKTNPIVGLTKENVFSIMDFVEKQIGETL